ncbi:MAG: hypothetical protein IFK94_14510 [Acidobacteria bacterium]|uniref:Uncharacterized protein n=1 Tax=Candidatus Polarisedimenticola svalbardensis TaxID=2886004 RepID=A0A8J7C2P8_9BACT|nr:hypothetical protein [Candidatus Polarisedimenticola svalbardensis]
MIRSNHSPRPVVLAVLGILLYLFPVPGPLAHGAHEPAAVEIVGEILDLECYVVHDVTGSDNTLCADNHNDDGRPMAVLADDGRLWILHAWHGNSFPLEQTRSWNGRRGTITGVQSERDHLLLLDVRAIRLNGGSP